jgi:hypothetical protein
MTNIAPTGYTITNSGVLDKEQIRKGGAKIVTLPTLNVNLSNEHESLNVEFCGYPAIVNYNKEREIQHRKDKENKRLRSLRRQIKNIEGRSIGIQFPEVTILDSFRGPKS